MSGRQRSPERGFTPATASRPPELQVPPSRQVSQAAAELPRSPRSGGRGARGPAVARPPGEWPTGGGVAWLAGGNTETAPQPPGPPVPRLHQVARMTQHGVSPEELQPLFSRRKGVHHQEGGGLGLTNPAARTDDTWEVPPPPSRHPRAAL
eukprot:scaffold130157_cov36-Phaeocystis_antarctica.AAC.1